MILTLLCCKIIKTKPYKPDIYGLAGFLIPVVTLVIIPIATKLKIIFL